LRKEIDDIPFKEKARVRAVRITQTRHTVDVNIRREGNRHKKKDVTERRKSLLNDRQTVPSRNDMNKKEKTAVAMS
jgi:hypothetical protein